MSGLRDVRVLELGEMVSAPYAGKLLGDLGADVVKVEPPGGDRARTRGPYPKGEPHPEKSGLFLYLNTNKRSLVLDLETAAGRERLDALICESDVLLHSASPAQIQGHGLDYARLRALRPELVLCSITPFGLTGPYRDYRAEEITSANAGGWAWLSPGASDRPDQPPLKAFGHQADLQAGLAGAMASLGALYRARHTGVGEHVDLSVQETVASLLEQALPHYTYGGAVASRAGVRGLNPWGIFACSDGLIFVCTIEQDQWERLVEFMGNPEWAQMEIFADFGGRLMNADVLGTFLGEWIADWKTDELFHQGQERRICFAPVLTMADLADQEHLRERGFYAQVDHPRAGRLVHLGAPYRLREPWWSIRRPAPLLDEHADELGRERAAAPPPRETRKTTPARARSGLPLEGVRVADLTWVWAGPYCCLQLAHLGAEVIKFESEGRPDLGRRLPIFVPDTEPSLNASGYFNQWNQGKKSLHLNLGHPGAADLAKRVIAECDVVVDNFATGVMEKLGLGYEALRAVKPDLVVASISGYGGSGPYASYMAYGPAIAPLAGLSSLSGYVDDGPREVGISLGDPTAGMNAAVAICAALVARQRTGRGQHIDVSLWESTAALVGEGWMDFALNGTQPERAGNRDPWMAPHGIYRCAGEEAWVSIACAGDAEWAALCAVVEPALARDARFALAADRKANEDELDRRIEEWTRTRDRWQVTELLQGAGVAAFPSLSPEDLANDPHLAARDYFETLPHPEVGPRKHAGIPWRLSNGPDGVRSPAPILGADTEEILSDLLGCSPAEISRLRRERILS